MTGFEIGLWSFVVLFGLILLRAPIGLAMFICGLGGSYLVLGDWNVPLARLKTEIYSEFSNYSLSVIPLFILMGQFASHSGLSHKLFKMGAAWLGHKKGGLAMASIMACAGFGSICGSSLATAATMGKTALPELRHNGYEGGFATATIAAGGTLGILIPPSVILVLYAIITEQNIAKLFIAALIPGLLATIGYMLVIALYVRKFPHHTQILPKAPFIIRLRALLEIWPIFFIFILVIGGIYGGIFSPTDGASVGAFAMFLFALYSGKMNWLIFKKAIIETAILTAMIYFILIGAAMYNGFLALTQAPQILATYITAQTISPWLILWIILLFYFLFGCVMDSLSMILLTVPIFFPIIIALDFGLSPEHIAIWFGILALSAVEIGLITPPVGMNLFILQGISKNISLTATYKAVLYFIASDMMRIAFLVSFPTLTLFLL